MVERVIPIDYACGIIEQYILVQKGVQVNINSILPHDKFIQALNVACAYFGITL